jgi:hypothetical protein
MSSPQLLTFKDNLKELKSGERYPAVSSMRKKCRRRDSDNIMECVLTFRNSHG